MGFAAVARSMSRPASRNDRQRPATPSPGACGVLEKQVAGREKLFLHPKLMRLLTQKCNKVTGYLSP